LYLSIAGLKLTEEMDKSQNKRKFKIISQENPDSLQMSIYKTWTGN
jgi:hypothetical protein